MFRGIRLPSLNPLLSEAGFSTRNPLLTLPPGPRLNPLLSEAGFSTYRGIYPVALPLARLNPLLSEAGFSTKIGAQGGRPEVVVVLILF